MKVVIVLVVGLALGYGVASWRLADKQPAPSPLIDKLTHLSQNEAKTYAEATTAEEKLKAADALYEKMMVIFLADVALRMQPIHKVDPVMKDQTLKEAGIQELNEPGELAPVESKTEVALSTEQKSIETKADSKKTSTEKILENYKKAGYSKSLDERTKALVGIFEGTISHQHGKKKGRVDSIRMSIDFFNRKGKIDGSANVVLIDPSGKEYSNSRGDGGNNTLKPDPANEDLIYIDTSPFSFIALKVSSLSGEFYDDGKLVGRVKLYRSR